MSSYHMNEEEMIKIVYAYAEKHKSFNLDLIDSFQEQWDEKGYLSDIQIQTLENIIDRFRMLLIPNFIWCHRCEKYHERYDVDEDEKSGEPIFTLAKSGCYYSCGDNCFSVG